MSFGQAGRYFSEYLQPKKFDGVLDFLATGLLPELEDMSGLYRQDYLEHCSLKTSSEPAYGAVFLSHAHADHSSHVHFLRNDIPIYASNVTRQILYAIEETSITGWSDFTSFTESFQLRAKKRGEGLMKLRGEEAKTARPFRVFEESRDSVNVGGISVEAVPVNHSLPGARAFIIHTASGVLVYTGDLRFHGYGGALTEQFVEKAAKLHPNVLLCEGTRIDAPQSASEHEVKERAVKYARDKTLVVVNFPVRDTERMQTFLEVARATGRKLAISTKQAFLLKQLSSTDAGAPSLDDENLAVYVRRKNWGLITKKGAFPEEIVLQDYEKWEHEFLEHPNAVTCKDISSNQTDFVVRVDFFELPDLIALRPADGSCYIRSVTEPHDEEDEIDEQRAQEWLKLFNLPFEQMHASGHLDGVQLKRLVQRIDPKVLIPIHTEKPEAFWDFVGPATQVIVPEQGKRYDMS
jgi:ribonuclease J